jgi:hypothetical protein
VEHRLAAARLAIEYRRIGLLASCIGNERIRIARDGSIAHSRNSIECEKGQIWSDGWHRVGQLGAASMTQLAQQIVSSGVLELPPESITESAEGGRREEMDVCLDEREYHFVVQNADSPAFRTVVALLWGVVFSSRPRA